MTDAEHSVHHGSVSSTLVRPEAVIDRPKEAAAIAEFILASERTLVALYGPPDSGKTALLQGDTAEQLRLAREGVSEVLFGRCSDDFPSIVVAAMGTIPVAKALHDGAIVIVDDFERVLDLPRDRQRQSVDSMLESLRSAAREARLVLVSDERHLNGIYALASRDPIALAAVRELPSPSVGDALHSLSAAASPSFAYTDGAVQAIADQCVELSDWSWSNTFPLARLVHEWALQWTAKTKSRVVPLSAFESADGARGILREYLERGLQTLDGFKAGSGELARGFLEQLVGTYRQGVVPNLDDVARLLGIDRGELDAVLDAMAGEAGLLRWDDTGAPRLIVPQVLAVVQDDLASRAPAIQRAQRALLDAWREQTRVGALPPGVFDTIHAQRRFLATNDEQCGCLAKAAAHGESDAARDAVRYWLVRMRDASARLDVAMAIARDQDAVARAHGAALLGMFVKSRPAAERIRELAVGDPDENVRRCAVESLANVKTDEDRAPLLQEANGSHPQRRVAAIVALRVFRETDVIQRLGTEVADPRAKPDARRAAIDSLASIRTPEAVDALLAIALRDADAEDRDAALHALGAFDEQTLNRRILGALSLRSSIRLWGLRFLLSLVSLGLLMLGLVIAAYVADDGGAAVAAYLGAGSVMVASTVLLTRRLRKQGGSLRSITGVLAAMSLLVNSVISLPLVHGLGNLSVGQRRRAKKFFRWEALAILLGLAWLVGRGPALKLSGWDLLTYLDAALAVLLFVLSYVLDVNEAFIGGVLLRRERMATEQTIAVYQRILMNPTGASLIANAALGEDRPALSRATAARLLRRYGDRVPGHLLADWLTDSRDTLARFATRSLVWRKPPDVVDRLEQLWEQSPDDSARSTLLRTRIARVLCKRPTEPSLSALARLAPSMTSTQRIRAKGARWAYPIAFLPSGAALGAVALLQIVVLLLHNGWKAQMDPTWSQVAALENRRPFTLGGRTFAPLAEEKQLRIVNFLGEVYPAESAPYLFAMLQNPQTVSYTSVKAELIATLAAMDSNGVVPNGEPDAWRSTLLRELGPFEDALGQRGMNDSVAVALHVRLLSARDTVIAATADSSLMKYLGSNAGADSSRVWRSAVLAVASLPYDRALPRLDGLVLRQLSEKVSPNPALLDELQQAIENIAHRIPTAAESRSDTAVDHAIATLHALSPQSQSAVVKHRIEDIESLARGRRLRCDRNADGKCSLEEVSLESIVQNPGLESGYLDLVTAYEKTGRRPRQTVAVLDSVIRALPKELWPRKTLAAYLHETVADTAGFQRSYALMDSLRRLPAYARMRDSSIDDYARIETDYFEIALTAGHYEEVDSLTRQFLRSTLLQRSDDDGNVPTQRYNTALFGYLASVMRRDTALAAVRLATLDSVFNALPTPFENNWSYPGTLAFLQRSELPSSLRDAVQALCHPGRFQKSDYQNVLRRNQTALGTLGVAKGAARRQ